MNIADPPEQSIAGLWPAMDARIRRIRDLHPLQTSLPPSKLSQVDRLAVGEAALVNASVVAILIRNASHRRPGARYQTQPKGEKHIIIERVA